MDATFAVLGRAVGVALAVFLSAHVVGAAVVSQSVDACLAADVNSDEYQQVDRVIGLCTTALSETGQKDMTRAELHQIRGVAFRNRGDLELSLKDLNAAIEIDKNNDRYLRMRAWTYRLMERQIDAEADYDRALAINPEWQGYLSRCVTRFDLEKFASALEDCDKSLELRRIADGLFFSAYALHKLGRSDEALPRIIEATKMYDAVAEHFVLLAKIQVYLGQFPNALKTAKEALKRFPDDQNLQNELTNLGLRDQL